MDVGQRRGEKRRGGEVQGQGRDGCLEGLLWVAVEGLLWIAVEWLLWIAM